MHGRHLCERVCSYNGLCTTRTGTDLGASQAATVIWLSERKTGCCQLTHGTGCSREGTDGLHVDEACSVRNRWRDRAIEKSMHDIWLGNLSAVTGYASVLHRCFSVDIPALAKCVLTAAMLDFAFLFHTSMMAYSITGV